MIWEYKTLTLPGAQERQSLLSEMGLNGWELVAFEQGLAYFKREKQGAQESKPIARDLPVPYTYSEQKPSKKK